MLEIFFILLSMHLTKGKNKTQKAKKPIMQRLQSFYRKIFFDFARNIMGEQALRFFEFLEMCYKTKNKQANSNNQIHEPKWTNQLWFLCGLRSHVCVNKLKMLFSYKVERRAQSLAVVNVEFISIIIIIICDYICVYCLV